MIGQAADRPVAERALPPRAFASRHTFAGDCGSEPSGKWKGTADGANFPVLAQYILLSKFQVNASPQSFTIPMSLRIRCEE